MKFRAKPSQNLDKALTRWLETVGEDDADSMIELASSAFTAGWRAAFPPIRGTSDGRLTHNADTRPGRLKFTLRGHTDDGQEIRLVLTEDAMARLVGVVRNTPIGLDREASQ